MQKATQLVAIFFLAALFTVAIASLLGTRIGNDSGRSAVRSEARPTAQPPATADRLREVQDAYLTILRDYPGDPAAMRGLVVVRRHLAGDDPVALRRQAAAYEQMAASGDVSPEHYPPQTMKVLAIASLQAAAAIESEQRNAAVRASRPGPPPRAGLTLPALPTPRTQNENVGSRGSSPSPSASPSLSASSKSRAAVAQAQPAAPPPARPGASPAAQPPAQQAPPAEPASPTAPVPSPPVAPAPQTPTGPPASPTPPQQPPAGAPAPPANPSDGTVAVVPPPTSGPALAASEGSLASVDCQKKTFVIHGSNGDEEYVTAATFTIYIRGPVSRRLSDFCGLRRHLGHTAVVWSVPDGDRKIAKSLSVVLPAQ